MPDLEVPDVKATATKLPGALVGAAGVHLVAAELSRLGYVASITLRNTRGIDVLASNSDASRQAGIQVKTRQRSGRDWVLNDKAEQYHARNLYYVFVNLKGKSGQPEFHVVPSKTVALYIKKSHESWLATLGKRGQKHRDSAVRVFSDRDGKYLSRWKSLRLG
jgi:hypothetical protein